MGVFFQIVMVFGAALAAALLFRVLRVPGIIGFLLAGIIIGPSGLQIIARENVADFAEIGLVLLLFVIGLELSPEPLIKAGRRLATATVLQVLLTTVVAGALARLGWGLSLPAAGIIGVAVSLSSTAIALKQLNDRRETNSTMGLIATGILLLQDVIVILFMLLLSIFAPFESSAAHAVSPLRIASGVAGLLLAVLLARRFLPWLIDQVVYLGGRELSTLLAVLGAAAGAWLATLAGWSPALGAAIAGFLLAGADQRHQMVAEVMPFRDVFNAIFFISLGMLLNTDTVVRNAPVLLLVVGGILSIKPVLTAIAVVSGGWPLRIGLQVGIGLCTVSEFGYILAFDSLERGLVPADFFDLFVACIVGTMMAGALLFPLAGPVAAALSNMLLGGKKEVSDETPEQESFSNHVIIVGYGLTGSNLARMLQATHVPFCVVEMNQALVQSAKDAGVPVVVGDAARMAIMELAGIDKARVLVTAINDQQATRRIIAQVSARRPELYILARTNFVSQIDRLRELGAKMVIPEDLETSIEVAAHVLRQYGIPDNIIDAQIASVRAGGYAILRGKPMERAAYNELIQILRRTTTQTFYLGDDSKVCGQTIAELNLRARTGCMIIAVVRNAEPTTNPSPDFRLQANDVLVLVGAHQQLEAAKQILQAKE